MHLEHVKHSKPENIPPLFEQVEISLASEKDLKNLESRLQPLLGKDAAEQCVFVLRSMADENFVNRCQDASKEFGRGLAANFGEEESFFELAPFAKFSVARSSNFVTKGGKSLKNHDVAILELESPQRQPFSLIFDLTYGDVVGSVKKDPISVFYSFRKNKEVMQMLGNHYGGSWKKELEFNPKTGHFVAG